MSIFKRIGSIVRNNKQQPAPQIRNPFEDSSVGDIVNVDLEQYVVTGKAVYFDRGYEPHRYAYYLQNGRNISCLLVEKSRAYECFLCEFLEGSLDDPHAVPNQLDIDGETSFHLEHHRTDVTRSEGNTDFRTGDDVMFWRYFSAGESYFFLQWQDGKFIAMKGERTPSSQVKFMNTK
ncbi:MAG: hypothetical protein K0R57_1772 [Paenibacillaceae bacterium]|jgi:hypothetical protein|nr:hypothetical protein [Paenibacillaceae bacterium]